MNWEIIIKPTPDAPAEKVGERRDGDQNRGDRVRLPQGKEGEEIADEVKGN